MKILRKILFVLIIVAGFFFYQYLPRENNSAKAPVATPESVEQASEAPAPEAEPVTFVFAGDMMFDRNVNHNYKDIGFDKIFANLDKSIFEGKDIKVANLEGPVSNKPIDDDYLSHSLVFNMPPETIPTIKNLGLNGVSLANNHTLNAGASGFKTTKGLLDGAGIKYAGSQDSFDASSTMRFETEIPVSVIAVDLLSYTNVAEINKAIASEKKNGAFVIVFPHWGEEYALKHNSSQANYAMSFIDAGADLIIGGHPHVIQDVSVYKEKPIIYSLGNFVFDQYFSEDTQEGLILSGTITKENLTINILPFKSVKSQMKLMGTADKQKLLDRINGGKDTIEVSIAP